MLRRILIANRGEIACRIIMTCRKLGVETVAVFSEADAGALHVAMADRALLIGGPRPADSYLRGDALIEAALASGAEAIHPGYGFLSENPDFVEAVEASGLVFIGPSAGAIRAMGLKDAAKALMHEAGVPVVPGYHGANQDPDHLAGAAEAIGWPVLIKAVAGGGGKGMRLVERAADFPAALEAARGEARTAFGNDAVLVEKFVAKPRHIEVQVFGDGQDALHLFERDCSLQRRHQKVIEEAPAPGMPPGMRKAMGAAAVRAARAIGYSGAGTVEFIVDASQGLREDRFWFMEMNTRLQVEHPVTEAITGIDLVEWQLRIASGESLPARQEDLAITGHAFEARLYAEDVAAGFLPATGRLAHLAFPPGVRADAGVRSGDVISPWYDPMIAKIVVHGPNRATALRRLHDALMRTEAAGTVTNLAFLRRLAGHRDFVAGDVDTGLIARDLEHLASPEAPAQEALAAAALAAAGLWDGGTGAQAGFALWEPVWHRQELVRPDGAPVAVRLALDGPDRARLCPGEGAELAALRLPGKGWRIGARVFRTAPVVERGVVHVPGEGGGSFGLPDALARGAQAGPGADVALAPMPGMVKAVFVAPGDAVAAGERLAILEAMKMEHTLAAARAGVVAEVLARAGDQVEAGAALVRLVPEGEETA
ncbi:MAG: ATP-grasp domain-containing protein [Rhodobacteraceae bacterium]|nr:ATP-grasp domain-containing protein [Paracoccaceae bacterium]